MIARISKSARPAPSLSFRGRITAAALVTALVVLLAGCILFVFEAHRTEQTGLALEGAHLSQALAGPASEALRRQDPAAAKAVLAPLGGIASIRGAYLLDAHGRLLASVGHGPSPDQLRRGNLLHAHQRLSVAGKPAGELVVVSRPYKFTQPLPRYFAMAAGLFFCSAGLALVLGRWLAERITEPVNRLSTAMREVAGSGDFARTVKRPDGEEIGLLTDSFNHLLAKLHANDQALRQTMDELVHARDVAEAANVMKSQFLANMSHEIRTPLNGVLAMAQVMSRSDLTGEQRDRLEIIRRSGEALLATLNDLLDVSKIEAGKLELEAAPFNPEEVVRGVQATFAPVADKKGLQLEVSFDPQARGRRMGDEARFRQIITNLVSNAVKFTEQGEVRITVMPAHDQPGLLVTVTDSGIGIAPEKLPVLFEKFSQADNSMTRRFGGTGLGLAICHDLAGLMGGRIWVESAEGVGSSFHLVLPLPSAAEARVAEAAAAQEAANEAEDRTLVVLAAEDNPTNQVVLSTVMQIFGVELVMVDNGKAAVDAWRERDFDVILMDIQMPVMDGVTATREIRTAEAESGRRRTPIVALSANAMTHQVQEYLAAGLDAHVAKPIELPKLQAALEAAVTGGYEGAAAAA